MINKNFPNYTKGKMLGQNMIVIADKVSYRTNFINSNRPMKGETMAVWYWRSGEILSRMGKQQ